MVGRGLMRLAEVMDDVAARLRSIPAFRTVFEYPAGSVTPPAAVVSYPDVYIPHRTYNRGMDTMTLPVVVVVGRVSERGARDLLSDFVDGAGASSVIAVLESGTYTAFHELTVSKIHFDASELEKQTTSQHFSTATSWEGEPDMAFKHGKYTFVSLDGDDLSAYTNTSELEVSADEHDVTCYGKDDHVFAGGLLAGSVSMGRVYDDTAACQGHH